MAARRKTSPSSKYDQEIVGFPRDDRRRTNNLETALAKDVNETYADGRMRANVPDAVGGCNISDDDTVIIIAVEDILWGDVRHTRGIDRCEPAKHRVFDIGFGRLIDLRTTLKLAHLGFSEIRRSPPPTRIAAPRILRSGRALVPIATRGVLRRSA